MTELLIFLAMCVVAWLAYARGHSAGVAECKREYFARTYLTGDKLFDDYAFKRYGK